MLPYIPGLTEELDRIAESAVQSALAYGGPRSGGPPRGEVAAVKAVILDGFARLANEWSVILEPLGYVLELRPVFVHSRPYVTFTRAGGVAGKCELADLLVVFDHEVPDSGIVDRRAVLIQAKIAQPRGIRLKGKEWVQFELLSTWPTFTFVSGAYDTRPRKFDAVGQLGVPVTSGEYGGITLLPAPPGWVQQLVTPPKQFDGDAPMGAFLAGMCCGRDMFGREAQPGGRDDWSFTVDELLRVTAALPITKSSPYLRGQSYPAALSMLETTPAQGGHYDPPPPADDGDEFWPDGPISTVHLIMRDGGEGFGERRL